MLSTLNNIGRFARVVNQPALNACGPFRQIVRTFRQRRTVDTKRKLSPVESVPEIANSKNKLLRPFLFTVSFGAVSFAGSSVWQYESMRKQVLKMTKNLSAYDKEYYGKALVFRQRFNRAWNEATKQLAPGQWMILGIIVCNVSVWMCWKMSGRALFAFLTPVMTNLFLSSPFGKAPCLSMVLSTFSHYSFLHLALNMYVLDSLSQPVVGAFGKEQTLGLYLTAGVVSSFASYIHKVARASLVPSIGASGAIFAILAAACVTYPDSQLSVVGVSLVYPHSFSASNGLKALMAFDTLGLLMGWRLFDHAAHLGGALFGLWYVKYGHNLIWGKREKFISTWHKLRGDIKK